jgi:enoyl-CoA hydratase/carnithine racemase
MMRRAFSTTSNIVVTTCKNNVATIRMNDPKKLNGWTEIMTNTLFKSMNDANQDDSVKVIILTGTDPYYCAGGENCPDMCWPYLTLCL